MSTGNTLKKKFFYITISALGMMVIFVSILYGWFESITKDRALNYFEGMSIKSERQLSNYLNDMEKIANLASYSNTVQEYLFEEKEYKRIEYQVASTDLMNNILSSYVNIKEIAFYDRDGRIIQTRGTHSNLIRHMIKTTGLSNNSYIDKPFITPIYFDDYNVYDSQTPYFFYVYPVYSMIPGSFYSQNSAVCIIMGRLTDISQELDKGFDIPNLTVAIMENNKIISLNKEVSEDSIRSISNIPLGRGSITFAGQKSLVYTQELVGTPWRIVIIAPESSLIRELMPVKKTALLFMVASFIILLILMILGMRSITRPINNLLYHIRNMEVNRKGYRVPVPETEELKILAISINEMLANIEAMTESQKATQDKLYQASLAQKQAELQLYQSQINPHFLYNTLECIRSMAQFHKIGIIEEICTSMARMFRYSVGNRATVTVKDELEHVQDYFNVISKRNSLKHVLRINVSDDAAKREIKKMVLQPIVENSIKYGFDSKEPPYVISIIGLIDECGNLRLKVADNGWGIPPKQLMKLNTKISEHWNTDPASSKSESGIGLHNINKRLKLSYNQGFSLSVKSKFGFYTLIDLTIPKSDLSE